MNYQMIEIDETKFCEIVDSIMTYRFYLDNGIITLSGTFNRGKRVLPIAPTHAWNIAKRKLN
jgi:hypothetical protein